MNDLIEIKHLRIGNLLSYEEKLVHVTSLSLDIDDEYEDQICFCNYGEVSNEKGGWNRSLVDKLAPIPLTPEWLERMGLQTETIPDVVDDEGDIIKGYTHWTNGKFCFHFSNGKVEGREHIKYVHLLQNWYYFNTFEELQIKNI